MRKNIILITLVWIMIVSFSIYSKSDPLYSSDTIAVELIHMKPQGQMLIYKTYWGNEFGLIPDTVYTFAGIFPSEPYYGFSVFREDELRDFKLCDSHFKMVLDTHEDFQPYSIDLEELDSLGMPLLLINGIDLGENRDIKALYSGMKTFSGLDENGAWRTLEFETDAGVLKVIPDITRPDTSGQFLPYDVPLYASYGEKTTLITKRLSIGDDGIPAVWWIGDLDGDDIPDMLINLTAHYNRADLYLCLSTLADEDQLYGLAACLHLMGC